MKWEEKKRNGKLEMGRKEKKRKNLKWEEKKGNGKMEIESSHPHVFRPPIPLRLQSLRHSLHGPKRLQNERLRQSTELWRRPQGRRRCRCQGMGMSQMPQVW